MRLLITLLLLCQVASAQNLRVGVYNVENLFDTINAPSKNDGDFTPEGKKKWNTAKYQLKVDGVRQAIASVGASVMGLCEVENAAVLREVLPTGYRFIHYESPDMRGIDVALIYDPAKFRVVSSEPITVSKRYKTRHILRVDGVAGKLPLTLIVAHLPSRLGNSTTAALQRYKIGKMIDSIAATSENVIAMGDFNQNPSPQLLRQMYNTTVEPFKQGKGSYAYRDVWMMYDQIFVSRQLRVLLDGDATVHNLPQLTVQKGKYRGYPSKGKPSDHFPVSVEIIRQ